MYNKNLDFTLKTLYPVWPCLRLLVLFVSFCPYFSIYFSIYLSNNFCFH